MGEGRVAPGFREEVVDVEGEELRPWARGVREVGLEVQPPFVGDGGGGEGQEEAGFEVVALRVARVALASTSHCAQKIVVVPSAHRHRTGSDPLPRQPHS